MQKSIWIYGAGGMGKETLWLIKESLENSFTVLGFIDDFKFNDNLFGVQITNSIDNDSICIIAISDSMIRKKKSQLLDLKFVNIIHPDVYMHTSNILGLGNIISKGVILTVNVKIGNHTIININTTIGHDCILDDFVTIMFGVHISGNVKIGEGTLIGSGAVILPNITIGKWSKIGAGAVVTKDIPDYKIYAGVPAIELS
jgi:sugar O-acyltransferase (sialic acid O-acetyltransferase NeuD family)